MPTVALDYACIPEYAALLPAKDDVSEPGLTLSPTRRFSLNALSTSLASPSEMSLTGEHAKTTLDPHSSYGFVNLLISSVIKIPMGQSGSSPRGPPQALFSTREPLSIPTTTSNFRRFVSRIGFLFWMLDRTEEIVMWRKGWKYTASWIVLYCTICYKPWLLVLLPNVAIMSTMLSSYHAPKKPPSGPSTHVADPSRSASSQLPSSGPAAEGSAAWLANIQALQNLMGFISDTYDLVVPFAPLVTFKSRATTPLFLFILFTTLPLVLLPLRLMMATAGLVMFTITYPFVRHMLFDPAGLLQQSHLVPYTREGLRQLINDVSLSEKHIASELKEISIYQNERWASPTSSQISLCNGNVIQAGWKNGVNGLKPGDRGAWTRGSDGSITAGESSSHISIELGPGWAFVETEDWEPDFLAGWAACGGDRDGWVYTNDAWLNPRPAPNAEWQKSGMTRRRRWIRRIYPIART